MTENEELRQRLRHQEIHHADALDEMRVRFSSSLKDIEEQLRKAKVALSRTPARINVVEYLIQESLDTTVNARTKLKPGE